MHDCQEPAFWVEHYATGRTPWDQGRGAPAFAQLLAGTAAPPPGRAIALGCGRGHDALLFAAHGFRVTGVDFAPQAIATAQAQAQTQNLAAEFQQQDIFNLPAAWQGQFDYVIEHTCFCAIAPPQRDRYVQVAQSLLRPGGELLGIFFTHNRPGGPPFGVRPEALRAYFTPAFQIEQLEPLPVTVAVRPEEEHFGRFSRP